MNNRKICVAALAICAALSISGCDFVRGIAGRPTSAEVEALRSEKAAMEARAAEEKAAAEALEAARQADAEAMEAFTAEGRTFRKVSEMKGLVGSSLKSGYYFIVGSFSMSSNAERVAAQLASKGYGSELIPYSNGLVAVGAAPSGSIGELYEAYGKLRNEEFFPKESWILINE